MFIPRGNFNSLKISGMDREMIESGFQAVESVPNGWAILGRSDVPGRRDCLYCGVLVERRPTCNICEGAGTVERSFMFDAEQHPDPLVGNTIKEINNAVNNAYGGHSGASYGYTMRILEFIAKQGWDAYVARVGTKPAPPSASPAIASAPVQLATLHSFINTLPRNTDIGTFASAALNNPGMRAMIPDIDEQVAGMMRYSKAVEDAKTNPSSWNQSAGFPYPCPCRRAQGKEGWCGVAGFGVPACEH